MRITKRLSVVLVVLLTSLLILQPVSAAAKDCSAEKAAFDALIKEVNALNDQLNGAYSKLGSAQADVLRDLLTMTAVQATLVGLPAKVQQELAQNGLSNSIQTLGPEVALSLLVALAAPALLGETITKLVELAEAAHTAKEDYQLYRDLAEAQNLMDEIWYQIGNLDAALAFANANGLTELKYLINQTEALAALTNDFNKAWARMEAAGLQARALLAQLDVKNKQLDDAQKAYYACLDQPDPEPSPNACGDQTPNPSGAGVCR
jgi:hypothetical protein